uniref:LIM zinc-binding domain-containing protein n=1 Tax=Acrobeloides nanus TaxID=290746 RepID=A0A914DQ84_9BILA
MESLTSTYLYAFDRMKLKELVHWTENTGISTPPWVNKDWQSVLHLMSKILADDLVQRRHAEEDDVTFKISFDAMLQIAEDVLGIPRVVVEEDLQQPNIHVALLTYMICVQHSLPHLDPKAIRDTPPPKLVFEAKINSSSLPTCPGCSQHAFLVERVVIGQQVWHRRCFKCTKCERLLHRGSYRCIPDMSPPAYECVEHLPTRILKENSESALESGISASEPGGIVAEKPNKPVPLPKPKNYTLVKPQENDQVKKEQVYEELDETNPFNEADEEGDHKTNRSSSVDSDIVAKLAEASVNIESPRHQPKSESQIKARVPPPRPPPPTSDRVSVIIQKQQDLSSPTTATHRVSVIIENKEGTPSKPTPPTKEEPKTPEEPLTIETNPHPPVPKPRTHTPHTPLSSIKGSPQMQQKDGTWVLVDYPGFLNPFGSDDDGEEDSSSEDEYDETLNPFADDSSTSQPSPAPKSDAIQKPLPSPRSVSSLSNDRPKSHPPPPPKPPRPSLAPKFTKETKTSRIATLPRAKKSYKAPPPPIPVRRKIEFTENKKYDSIQSILGELRILEEEHERLEVTGRSIEKDILFTLERNALEWKKNKKVEDFLAVIEHKCDVIRKESVLVHLWLEHFLNEIHSDTEYQLRCLLEQCEGKERTNTDVKREAELLEVLVDIMGLKNGMIESKVDPASIIDGSAPKPKKSDVSAMKKMKTRLKKLKKKL